MKVENTQRSPIIKSNQALKRDTTPMKTSRVQVVDKNSMKRIFENDTQVK